MARLKTLLGKAARAVRSLNDKGKKVQPVSPISSNPEEKDIMSLDISMGGWLKAQTGELLEGFHISSEDVVLDAGSGYGDSPFIHFCAMQGADIIIADIDAIKVSTLKEKLKDSRARSVTALVGDACSLPLADASVSKIIAMEIMEHVDDPAVFLKELKRVGKPGAQYLISVPDPASETIQDGLLPPGYFEKPNHVRVVERRAFERLVAEAGLIVEQHRYDGFYWSLWWLFFWACKQELCPPWHPLLESWTRTWILLLETPQGALIKSNLDHFLPKSQTIIARKPDAECAS